MYFREDFAKYENGMDYLLVPYSAARLLMSRTPCAHGPDRVMFNRYPRTNMLDVLQPSALEYYLSCRDTPVRSARNIQAEAHGILGSCPLARCPSPA